MATATRTSPRSTKPPTFLALDDKDLQLRVIEDDKGRVTIPDIERKRLMHRSSSYFMSQLVDERGTPLTVGLHQSFWLRLFSAMAFLCLLAPRDHGKSWTVVAYLLWRVWRHNRDPWTCELKPGLPDGRWEAVLFSATKPQAETFFEVFQSLMLANAPLFGDILPDFKRGRAATIRNVWSRTRSRLKNRAEVSIRAFQTSTRGLHPDLIVLDDVLHDKNSLTQYQRDKVWRYFAGTLLPMSAKQVIVVGTAFHYDDLLHRLRPKPSGGRPNPLKFRFDWHKFKALDVAHQRVLWPGRHSYEELMALREFDATNFSREYQNDPVDDAASMFPTTLTGLAEAREYTFVPSYRANRAQEYVVGGYDVAASSEVGADFAVLWVATVERQTGHRRMLWGERHKGLGFPDQIKVIRDAIVLYNIDLLIVEENGLQRWLKTELDKFPETARAVLGHTTGQEKGDFSTGVPSLKIGLANRMWQMPTGDEVSHDMFKVWQTEMAAFGWKDGKLQGLGEHDDTVMAFWFLDRAIRLVDQWVTQPPTEEIIYGEDIGIMRVRIGDDY